MSPVLLTTTTNSVRIGSSFSPCQPHLSVPRKKKYDPPQRRRGGRKAHDRRRRGHARSSGLLARANEGRRLSIALHEGTEFVKGQG